MIRSKRKILTRRHARGLSKPLVKVANKTIDRSKNHQQLQAVWLLAGLALVLRGAVAFANLANFDADPDAYRALAESFAQSGVFGLIGADDTPLPTAFRPPLYPYVLSWLVNEGRLASVSVAVLHVLLGALTVVMTYLAAQRMLPAAFSRRGGIVAALIVLVDPILLQQSTEVMTETLATALTVLVLWWWSESIRSSSLMRVTVLGLTVSMAYLCRPTFLVWGVLLCAGWLVIQLRVARHDSLGRVWLRFALLTGILTTTVGLWTLRNARTIGHPVWGTSHGGYTLLLANNPSFYDYLKRGSWGQVWDSTSFQEAYRHRFDGDPTTAEFWQHDWSGPSALERGELIGLTEHGDDRLAYQAAKATIRREPGWFVWSCVVRVGRLWSPMPHVTAERSWWAAGIVGAWYLLIYGSVVAGLLKLWRSASVCWEAWWPAAALCLTLSAVHAVYWSNMRMRAPAIPALALLVATATPSRRSRTA